MSLISCQNCWFNGLQYGSVGLPAGFCARHRAILNASEKTTCGQHMRKDLSLGRAGEFAAIHARAFDKSRIVRVINGEEIRSDYSISERDLEVLRKDPVGNAAIDYGSLGSKMESLAQLSAMKNARSDLAMISLGRAYIRNCNHRGGPWTSGIHLYWWTKSQLSIVPTLRIEDIRYSGAIQLHRQMQLAAWSIMMLRITLIDDIIDYANRENDVFGRDGGVSCATVLAVQSFNVNVLSAWIRKKLIPLLDSRLPRARYVELSQKLHKDNNLEFDAE